MAGVRYTDKQLGDALKEARGMVYVAADKLGCSPNTLKARLEKSVTLREIQEAARGMILDTGETKLVDAVEAGEAWAVKFLLATQGKDRGYTERTEIDHSGKLEIEYVNDWRSQ